MVATDALLGSPVGGLDVAVFGTGVQPVYSLSVRILEYCPSASSWLIARRAFTIRGAAEIKIVIGDMIVLNWVGLRNRLYMIDIGVGEDIVVENIRMENLKKMPELYLIFTKFPNFTYLPGKWPNFT